MIVRYALSALLLASIGHQGFTQEAFTYPEAVPPLGLYTFDVREGSLPLSGFNTNPPYNLGAVTFSAPFSSTHGFMLKAGYPYASSFNSATHCRFTVADPPEDTEYEYAFLGTGAIIALGTASTTGGVNPYADAYTAWVLPSYFATDYQDNFENGVACLGSYTPVSVGELQTNYGTFSDVVLVQREFNCGGNTATLYQWYAQNDVINILAEYNTTTQLVTLNIPTGFSAVGIEEERTAQVQVFPNPATGSSAHINGLPANTRAQLSLLSMDGRLASQAQPTTGNDGSLQLELDNMADGAYILLIQCGTGQALRLPLVINH